MMMMMMRIAMMMMMMMTMMTVYEVCGPHFLNVKGWGACILFIGGAGCMMVDDG